jgi:hypothetical protein
MVGILGEADLQTLNTWLPAIPANQRLSYASTAQTQPHFGHANTGHAKTGSPNKSGSFAEAFRDWLNP